MAVDMISLYKDFVKYFLCIPVLMGEKTEGERFAGANNTYTIEALMQDGQALQCGTSHYLAQNFSKTYDIKYQTKNNTYDYVHQTSAGASTRLIGAIIMSHSDDKGLVLPIGVAPVQVAILPIFPEKDPRVKETSEALYEMLHTKYRVKVDNSDKGFGFKVSEQEVNGTPITLVFGPKDVQTDTITLIRRDDGIKISVPLKNIVEIIEKQIHEYQISIYKKAEDHLNASIVEINTLEDLKTAIANKKIAKAL
jgi:prolyl-tRNA synthetase